MSNATTIPDKQTGDAVDLYREVHKGLRLALFELVGAAGALDDSSPRDAEAFARLFADIDMMLVTHHGHEDGEHLAALIERHAPEAATRVVEAHDRINARLAEIRSLVAESTAGSRVGAEIYDSVVRFVADYLDHMNDEETVVMPALQGAVPVDELMAITMAIRTSVPPPDMCVFLRYMLPAMNPDERTATLGGMKAGAPPEIFALFWGVAEASLSKADLATVASRITDGGSA